MSEMTDEEEKAGNDREPEPGEGCLAADLYDQKTNSVLLKELEAQTRLAEQRLEQIKYLQADFDNYRKQFEKEKERIINYAAMNLIREILTVVDDLERTLRSISDPVIGEGVSMIYRNLLSILSRYGVSRIESVGNKLDPELHDVLCEEQSDKDEGTVIEEFSPGYRMKSHVLRPAKVKVAAGSKEKGE